VSSKPEASGTSGKSLPGASQRFCSLRAPLFQGREAFRRPALLEDFNEGKFDYDRGIGRRFPGDRRSATDCAVSVVVQKLDHEINQYSARLSLCEP